MRSCGVSLSMAAVLACAAPAAAQPGRAAALRAAFPHIDAQFTRFAERSHVPGAAWGVVVDGELVHVGSHGAREVASRAPVNPDTVFRIASMTKSFTALAILDLRDRGRLSLDDPAEKYVPELAQLRYPTADSPRITIRHLLSHAEGWPEDNAWGDRQLAIGEERMTEMLRQGIPFSNAPGVAYEYSNFGYAVLGRIVARASGMPHAEYVTSRILRPLGMTATTFEPSAVPSDRLAHGYRWEDRAWREEPQLADGAFGPMGGMLSSVRDLARYVTFMLSAWPPRDDPDTGPVGRASVREMQQVWRMAPATAARDRATGALQLNAGGYGYGLRVWQTCSLPHVVAHSGGLPGFGSHMRWLPDRGVGIVALGNRTYTGWGPAIDEAIETLVRTGGLTPRPVPPSPALTDARDAVSRLVAGWDDRLADRIAAENLFLDESRDRRRRAFEALKAEYGACTPDGPFDVENALRGTWLLSCERGTLQAAVTLAPTMPPKVQVMEVRPFVPPAPGATTACRP